MSSRSAEQQYCWKILPDIKWKSNTHFLLCIGWHGLAMAKTYHEVCHQSSMLIIDSAKSIGGTWAKERLYPGLKTNNIIGSYEFGDFPMTPEQFGVKPGQHIPGAVVHEYLCQFAEKYDLMLRMRLLTKVESAELRESGEWLLQVRRVDAVNDQKSTIMAKRIVIATGLTSEPHVPEYAGRETFGGNFLHSRQLTDCARDIQTSQQVVVVGSNKSAWDTCYTAAMSGAHVHMVIRPGGGGPSYVWPVNLPFNQSLQKLATTRFFTLFEPCIWAGESSGLDWARRLLHRTWLGRQIVKLFWGILGGLVISANKYSSHPELEKLRPWTSAFWMGNALSVHNYETDWFQLVKQGKISVHIADVTSLSGNKVYLSGGKVVVADTFVCCTGWKVKPPITFLPDDVTTKLGLPGVSAPEDDILCQKAKKEIIRSAPELRWGPSKLLPKGSAPIVSTRESRISLPYRLYRFMVPPAETFLEKKNIAFMGAHLAVPAITVAQTQALWITAFFQGLIPHLEAPNLNSDAIRYQTILHAEYCRLRHPPAGGGAGERCPDLIFDGFLYNDLLLRDVKIENFRKQGVWQELFERYLPKDYAGLTTELTACMQRTESRVKGSLVCVEGTYT